MPVRRVERRDTVYRRLLGLADVVSAALALTVALSWLGEDEVRPQVVLALPLVIIVAKLLGLYDRDALVLNKTTLDEAPQLFQAATLYTLLISLGHSFVAVGDVGARQLLALWAMMLVMAVACRAAVRALARRATETERILVLGGPAEAVRLASKLQSVPKVNAVVVGRIPLDASEEATGDGAVLGSLEHLDAVVAAHHIHRVIVAPSAASSDSTLDAIRAAKAVGVQVSVLPRLLEVVGSSVEFDQIYGLTVLGVRRFGLTQSSQIIKRTTDAVGALLLLVALSPLLAALAVLVKRSSPGPVLFRQRRIGKDGRPFELIKFRTMLDGADAMKLELLARNEAVDGLFKIADDPRMTRIGRFLRRSSLDELPQLINVLRGEMSLVGPRPLVPEEDERIVGRHRRRLHLKPGMTGQWQIFGSSRIPMRDMVTIDYLYVANWSLWGDVKILCRTLPYVLSRGGL